MWTGVLRGEMKGEAGGDWGRDWRGEIGWGCLSKYLILYLSFPLLSVSYLS